MTKEQITQKIKELLAKDKTFADTKVKIIFSKKNNIQGKINARNV